MPTSPAVTKIVSGGRRADGICVPKSFRAGGSVMALRRDAESWRALTSGRSGALANILLDGRSQAAAIIPGLRAGGQGALVRVGDEEGFDERSGHLVGVENHPGSAGPRSNRWP